MLTSSWLGRSWVPTTPCLFSHSFLPSIPFSERSLFCSDAQVQPLFTSAPHSFSKVPSSPSLSPPWFQTVLGFGGVEDEMYWPLCFQALPVSLVFNEGLSALPGRPAPLLCQPWNKNWLLSSLIFSTIPLSLSRSSCLFLSLHPFVFPSLKNAKTLILITWNLGRKRAKFPFRKLKVPSAAASHSSLRKVHLRHV